MKLAARIATRFGFSGKSRNHSGRAASPAGLRWAKGSGAPAAGRLPAVLLAALFLAGTIVFGSTLASAAAPTVVVDPASEVGFTSVKATGEVDPGDKETFCHFEYISDKQLEENEANGDPGFANAAVAGCDVEPLSGSTAQPVAANLENLTSATTYHLRLLASNEDGTEMAVAPNFTTQTATPPALALDPPSGVSYTKAHISGTVDPEGGNVNPIGGPTPIAWQLEINFQGFWEWVEGGVIQEAEAESSSPIAVFKDLEFLPPNTNFKFRLKAFYTGRETTQAGGEFTTLAVSQPTVAADDAASVTGGAAHFSGTVTAGGEDPAFNTNCTFDYVTDAQFQIDEFASASPLGCDVNPVTGTTATAVAAEATDLQPNTTYHLRLRGENAGGQSTSAAPDTFTTEAIAPTIADAFATDVTQSSATLNAKIGPGGIPTTYHFEYLSLAQFEANGATFAGAFQTPESASIGKDNSVHQVSANISGLQLGTAYRFRVVAANAQSGPGGTPGAVAGFSTPKAAASGGNCPNEQLRIENNSTTLPDCRAYELVTPDLNHAGAGSSPGGQVSLDGGTFVYQTIDAPSNAQSTSVFNIVRATRDHARGWSGKSLSPPRTAPPTVFQASLTVALSADLSSTAELSDQPLTTGNVPPGQNLYVSRPDGTYRLLTKVGGPLLPFLNIYNGRGIQWGNADFSNVYFNSNQAQLEADPAPGSSIYAWSEDEGLRLIGWLPSVGGEPEQLAPNGSTLLSGILQPASEDGRYVAFTTDGKIYLRIDDSHTVEVGGPVNLDPTHYTDVDQAGVTPDGSTVLFTSRGELTPDANTGGELGRDIYSYDTATEQLTDLTPDPNPADVAGANVQRIFAATDDGSYVYFSAIGDLTNESVPGPALYVWHDGQIDLVAKTGVSLPSGYSYFYSTPDGRHGAFASVDPLTGYDNTSPLTEKPVSEVFKFTYGGGLDCVSCRPNGTRPTGASLVPQYSGLGPAGHIRPVSDDGSRVFFESTDAVLPQASNGFKKVFEYSDGKVSALSPVDASFDVGFLDATPSGNDVFLNSYDGLTPNPNAGDYEIVNARVGGGFPQPSQMDCSGSACQGEGSQPPPASQLGSRGVDGSGNRRARKHCKKNQVRRNGRCVGKKPHKSHARQKPHKRSQKTTSGGAK